MKQPLPPASDARERFLLAIAGVIAPERLVELHFFPPIRQGPIETGVAVIAAEPESAPAALVAETPVDASGDDAGDAAGPQPGREPRHVVFSARYRWTRKGPDRGKWDQEIVAEADAPLITVEAVVHGVKERANEEFEPERMTGDEARALVAEAEKRRLRAAS